MLYMNISPKITLVTWTALNAVIYLNFDGYVLFALWFLIGNSVSWFLVPAGGSWVVSMCVLQSVHDVCRTGVIYVWCDIFVCAATQPVRMLVHGRWYRDGSCQVELETFDAPPVVAARFPRWHLMPGCPDFF